MAREVPVSPAKASAALDAMLNKAPRPAMPPGLAARIVAQATALPQLPAEAAPLAEPSTPRETAQVIPFTGAEARPARVAAPSRVRFAVGGLAAAAAAIAAVVLLGQPAHNPVQPGGPTTVMARQQPAAQPSAIAVPAAETPVQLAQVPLPPAARGSGAAAEKRPDAQESVPVAPPVAVPEAQLASTPAQPSRETAGPTSDPSPRPALPRGLMGPPAPQQGWGFSGGAPGAGLPGGQALPSQTTGSAPPPPPPPGN